MLSIPLCDDVLPRSRRKTGAFLVIRPVGASGREDDEANVTGRGVEKLPLPLRAWDSVDRTRLQEDMVMINNAAAQPVHDSHRQKASAVWMVGAEFSRASAQSPRLWPSPHSKSAASPGRNRYSPEKSRTLWYAGCRRSDSATVSGRLHRIP